MEDPAPLRHGLLQLMPPERADYYTRVAREISQSATGYALGNLLTSLIAGVVVFVTLTLLGVPFPLLWALWVALVDFLPMVGGALAGIPTVLFALGHSLTAGIVTAAAFVIYQQIENHVLNPVIMSRTANVNPLLVLLSLLIGASIGDWVGGFFGSFVAALLAIPVAAALQVITRELWRAARGQSPAPAVRHERATEPSARHHAADPRAGAGPQSATPGQSPGRGLDPGRPARRLPDRRADGRRRRRSMGLPRGDLRGPGEDRADVPRRPRGRTPAGFRRPPGQSQTPAARRGCGPSRRTPPPPPGPARCWPR